VNNSSVMANNIVFECSLDFLYLKEMNLLKSRLVRTSSYYLLE